MASPVSVDHVHVIGAGLAGLSCAVRLVAAGRRVTVYESAGHAGGRCRSYRDSRLERRIDNGNHLLLSGNRSAFAYLSEIGSADSLVAPDGDGFPFLDLQDGRRWTVPVGLRCLLKVPGGRWRDYLGGFGLYQAGGEATVAGLLDRRAPVYRNFWEPLAMGILNISAEEGAAHLMGAVLKEIIGQGLAACRPRIVREGLSESFVDPALARLKDRLLFNRRLRSLEFAADKVSALNFGDEKSALAEGESVVLAVPPTVAGALVPGLTVPGDSRAIVNGHFRLDSGREGVSMLGMVGGVGQWLFVRGDIASVTVSAAAGLVDETEEDIARSLWAEVAVALGLGEAPLPPYRIVKEKRATFAQTPEQIKLRPGAVTAWKNLYLAGDWTDTGLPATIEGAVRSGHTAASKALKPV
ncbi:MAG: hypothetical protein A3G18_06570 [Rhodospirillales bacterium RIFCSPLOWO2_12_FULL_58_28]|nr:MAG: hypothetical protein A3H92_08780 [Rhodospirillales bacterium RIFCSPLOWO2_02_FULL_58_16]OHC79184.1 MAG: hypothetical protein A3G18_06570 [Rhodospirillales bacterium RIFCSPLOWO2_12_FULL_58_28]